MAEEFSDRANGPAGTREQWRASLLFDLNDLQEATGHRCGGLAIHSCFALLADLICLADPFETFQACVFLL
jgi:hypothetical protein